MLREQEETFTEISTKLIGWVTVNTISPINGEVIILLSFCFKLPLTTAGVDQVQRETTEILPSSRKSHSFGLFTLIPL